MKRVGIKGTIIPNDYRNVYGYFGVEATAPADVSEAIAEADGDEIVFEINSGGGSIFAGSEIYNAIRSYQGEKRIEIVGLAGSAASMIACAAESAITPTGMLMIHNVSGSGYGDHQVFEREAAALQECDRAIASAYVEKTGMDRQELLDMMNAETWISAERAVEMGFVDGIIPASGLYNGFCEILSDEQVKEARTAMAGKAAEAEMLNILKLEVKND